MHNKIVQRVADDLVLNNVINSEDRELYTYGLQQGLFMLLNILTIVIVGQIFRMLWQSIVFMISYIPLRVYAGGYHARTPVGCYIGSVILIVVVLLGIKFIPWTNFICITVALISGTIIYVVSPVEDSNKPLTVIEAKAYGKNAKDTFIIELCMLILLTVLSMNNVAECIAASLLALNFMLLLGKVKRA